MTGSGPTAIEAALSELPRVRDVVVLAREDEAGDTRLVAYVVPEGPFDPQRLQAYLDSRLPQGAVPVDFVPVSCLPLDDREEPGS